MKSIINKTLLLVAGFTVLVSCGVKTSFQSEASEIETGIDINQHPIEAIQKAIELSKNINDFQSEIVNKEPVEPISFNELISSLPQPPKGWKAEKPSGETNSFSGYSISQVNQTYSQGDKEVTVSIFDWAFNSALYTPFLLSTEFSRESTEGYSKGVKINSNPGREEYTYQSQEGSLNLLVNNRFFVQIDGSNIEDTELREWWQLIDHKSLTKSSEK